MEVINAVDLAWIFRSAKKVLSTGKSQTHRAIQQLSIQFHSVNQYLATGM